MTRRELLAMAATGAFAGEHLNRAPVSHENLTVKLAEAEPVKLSNGVTLLAIEDNRLPIALVRFQMEDAGAIYSPRSGVAECTSEMLIEGGGGRSGKQIADEAARLGATLSSSAPAAAEAATVEASGLTSRFSEWLDLAAAVMLHPSFPADEFSAVKQRWRVRSRLRLTQPSNWPTTLCSALFMDLIRRPRLFPSGESLATVTPEMLAQWHRERYTPAKTIVLCIGRVRTSSFVSRMEKLLGGWKAAEANPSPPPPPQPASARRIVLIDRPGAAQTELAIGGLLMERRDPDFIAMVVLNSVLGGTIGSRLYPDSARREGILLQPGQRLQRLPLCGILAREGRGTDGRGGGFDCHRPGTTPPFVRRAHSGRRTGPGEIERDRQFCAKAGAAFAGDQSVLPSVPLRILCGLLGALSREGELGERGRDSGGGAKVPRAGAGADRAVGDAARVRPALDKLGKVET